MSEQERLEQFLRSEKNVFANVRWAGRILRELKQEGKLSQEEFINLMLSLYQEVNK